MASLMVDKIISGSRVASEAFFSSGPCIWVEQEKYLAWESIDAISRAHWWSPVDLGSVAFGRRLRVGLESTRCAACGIHVMIHVPIESAKRPSFGACRLFAWKHA